MAADTSTAPAQPRPSATVLITRDTPDGLELFMVARDRQVDFASGAVVFPGGKVDRDDSAEAWQSQPVPTAPERPYWIAAVRETFEESGLLIAQTKDGRSVDAETAAHVAARYRTKLLDGATTFSALMLESGLQPAFNLMVPFAHWITPVTVPKRFETHFFLIAALPGQIAVHDGREAVRSFWARPSDIIADARGGAFTLVPATEANIELLAQSGSTAAAMDAARRRPIAPVTPVLEKADGGMRLTIRQDAGYPRSEMFLKRTGA